MVLGAAGWWNEAYGSELFSTSATQHNSPPHPLSQGRLPAEARRRTEFLPVEWRQGAMADETALALSHVTPNSVPLLRQFANEVRRWDAMRCGEGHEQGTEGRGWDGMGSDS